MRSQRALSIVDAGYDLGGTDADWVEHLARAASLVDMDGPLLVSLLRREEHGVRMLARAAHPADSDILAVTEKIESRIPPDVQKFYGMRFGCETASEFAEHTFGPLATELMGGLYDDTLYAMGKRDVFNVQGADPSGFSIWLAWAVPAATQVHPRVRHTWNRVATHLLAALRLRFGLVASSGPDLLEEASAVLTPEGRCLHAKDDAQERTARDVLRDAALAVDRAHTRDVSDEDALELWKGLFAGHWTLCETFDSDGRRYYVALENEPAAVEDRRLTRREGQIVALAALGRGVEEIAYGSGLSVSTVRTHMDRALAKLHLDSPFQLIAFASLLSGQPPR